jgi:hypothetical protein
LLAPSKSSDEEGLSASDSCRFFIQNPALARGKNNNSMGRSYQKSGEDDNAVLRFVQIPIEVLTRTDISQTAKLVYGVIFTRENGKNGAWPSQKSLTGTVGVGVRALQDAIKQLESLGLMEVEQRGLRRSNVYSTRLPDRSKTAVPDAQKTALQDAQKTALQDAQKTALPIGKEQVKTKKEPITAAATPPQVTGEDECLQVSGSAINQLLATFHDHGNSAIKFQNKTQRKDAAWLIKEKGLEQAIEIARFALLVRGRQYAPVITNPSQLRDKLASLEAFGHRLKNGDDRKPSQQWHVAQ